MEALATLAKASDSPSGLYEVSIVTSLQVSRMSQPQILTFSSHGVPMINSAARKIKPKTSPSVQKAVREM